MCYAHIGPGTHGSRWLCLHHPLSCSQPIPEEASSPHSSWAKLPMLFPPQTCHPDPFMHLSPSPEEARKLDRLGLEFPDRENKITQFVGDSDTCFLLNLREKSVGILRLREEGPQTGSPRPEI